MTTFFFVGVLFGVYLWLMSFIDFLGNDLGVPWDTYIVLFIGLVLAGGLTGYVIWTLAEVVTYLIQHY